MKHPIEKPSEAPMRFFTRELYLQFNSTDDGVADRADEAWESALRDYQTHLETIGDRLPSPVKRLASLCLHDAELLHVSEQTEPAPPPLDSPWPFPLFSRFALLSLAKDEQFTVLVYLLTDKIAHTAAPAEWPFADEQKAWMYDEVDLAPHQPGSYLQRVLFSDGSVMEIPFSIVVIDRFSAERHEADAGARKSR